jgi:putative transposase
MPILATRHPWPARRPQHPSQCSVRAPLPSLHRNPSAMVLQRPFDSTQYASESYRQVLGRHGITQSMSRKGNCLDNAPMESFFASLKKEHVHRVRFRTREEAKAAVFDYVEIFYNRQRLHSALGYRTPAEARAGLS